MTDTLTFRVGNATAALVTIQQEPEAADRGFMSRRLGPWWHRMSGRTSSKTRRWRLALTVATTLCIPTVAQSADFTIAVFPSPLGAVLKKAVIEPFRQASKLDVVADNREFGVGAVRAKIQGGGNVWDIVTLENVEALQGCDEGYFIKIDKSKLPDLADFDLMDARFECGIPFIFYSTVLGYNKKKLKEEPTSWADFWDTKKWPGKRAIYKTPQDALEIALLADGVPRGDVYKVLATTAGVDRAFKKLDQLKPNIVWWTNPGQSRQMLASGEVTMSTTYDNGIRYFNKTQGTDFGLVRKDAVTHVNYYAIIAGSKHIDTAYAYLNFASKPQAQAAVTNGLAISVPNRKALPLVDKDLQPYLTTNPENLKDALQSDAKFWLNNFDALATRFNAWVATP